MSKRFDKTAMPELGLMEHGPVVLTLPGLHEALHACAKDLPGLQKRRNEAMNDHEAADDYRGQLGLMFTFAEFFVEGWRLALDRQSEEWRNSEDGEEAWERFAEWEAYLEELRDLEMDLPEDYDISVPSMPTMLPVDLGP